MVEFRDRRIDDVTINSILLCLYIKQIDSKFSNVVTWDLFVKLIKSFKPAKCGKGQLNRLSTDDQRQITKSH